MFICIKLITCTKDVRINYNLHGIKVRRHFLHWNKFYIIYIGMRYMLQIIVITTTTVMVYVRRRSNKTVSDLGTYSIAVVHWGWIVSVRLYEVLFFSYCQTRDKLTLRLVTVYTVVPGTRSGG